MADGPLARLFCRIFDGLDYWIMQARLWAVDAVCGPLPDDGSLRLIGSDGPEPTIR